MGLIRKIVNHCLPSRHYQSFELERVKSSKFSKIRRKKKTSSIGKILHSVSFFIAALCIFEAAVWFSTGFPEPENNQLRIFYLETHISIHSQSTSLDNPFEITAQIVAQSSLLVLLLVEAQGIFDRNKYLTDQHRADTPSKHSSSLSAVLQHRTTDWIVLLFLTTLASPKKQDRWIQ
mmetsp:Transcript_40631/g.66776  ORF Transcript_40631/g.66776 Transcript_40631/m.66776 type:complete len:177 (-) Transcript_40631:280-810(-)